MGGFQAVLLTRDRANVKAFEDQGAIVETGDLEDGEFVSRATATADALFWVTPTPLSAGNLRIFQNRLGTNVATAVVTNRIGRVVNLSSIGAHLGHGTGPIDGLHDVEQHLNEAAVAQGSRITHLRPAFFMENYLGLIGPIVERGIVPLPISGDRAIPMVATGDVAVEAVRQLAFPGDGWEKTKPLHGPRDVSFDEAAGIIGNALKRPVRHIRTSPGEHRKAMTALGASDDVAARMVEMYEGLESGNLSPEHRRADAGATPTGFRVFCNDVLAPEIRLFAEH